MKNKIDFFHGHGISEPIGLEYIAANLIQNRFSIYLRHRLELEVWSPEKPNIKVSFITANTAEYNEAANLAEMAKKRGNFTLLGGYHASYFLEHEPDDCFDLVVIGEGEEIGVEVLNDLFSGKYSWPQKKVIRAQRIKNIDTLPPPIRQKEFLSNYKLFDLMWPPASLQKDVAIVLASRGCAYDCDFCASKSVWGRGVRLRSTSGIVNEIEDIQKRFGVKTIVFIDQSFGLNPKWSVQLCNTIKEANLDISWYNQSNLTIKRDVIKAMADAGCKKIGFGLEGISPDAVEHFKSQNPHDFEKINDLFAYCNSLGIFVKVYLMIGSPWETKAMILDYFKYITKIRANEIKISYFTPFPGTRTWQQYSKSLITHDWSEFDTVNKPVVYNPEISVKEYHDIRSRLFQTFYSSKAYQETTLQMIRDYRHYIESFREFSKYLKTFGMVNGSKFFNTLLNGSNSASILLPEVKNYDTINY